MQMRKRGETVKPKAMLALSDLVGPTKAARMIGIAAGTLHRNRNSKETTKAYEMASVQCLLDILDRPIDESSLTPLQLKGLEYARKHVLRYARSAPEPEALPEFPEHDEVTTEPVVTATELEEAVRGVMLVEGPRKAIDELRKVAGFLGVRTEE